MLTMEDYPDKLGEEEFKEIILHFFSERPRLAHKLFSASSRKRPSSAGHRRSTRQVDVLRKSRLRSDIRHSFDGITPLMLVDMAAAHANTDDAALHDLGYCASGLLRLAAFADGDARKCWAAVCEELKTEEAAAKLLLTMVGTKRSYAAQEIIGEDRKSVV